MGKAYLTAGIMSLLGRKHNRPSVFEQGSRLFSSLEKRFVQFSGDSAYMGSDSRASGTSNTSESSPHRRTFADSLSQDSEDRLSTQMKQSTLSRVSNDTARAESIDTGELMSAFQHSATAPDRSLQYSQLLLTNLYIVICWRSVARFSVCQGLGL